MTTGIDELEAMNYVRSLAEAERDGTDGNATISIGPFSAFTLIGALQLAMRHPLMSDTQRFLLEEIVDQMMPLFAGTPGEQLIALGADPDSDVPHGCQYPSGPHSPECPPGPHRGFTRS